MTVRSAGSENEAAVANAYQKKKLLIMPHILNSPEIPYVIDIVAVSKRKPSAPTTSNKEICKERLVSVTNYMAWHDCK